MKIYAIGDSISIHYTPYLQSFLKGAAEFSRKDTKEEALFNLNFRQGDNGGDSSMVLSFLKAKAMNGTIDADLLLLNCGLHDIKTNPNSGEKQIAIYQYEKNLREIIKVVKNCGLKLVWIRTTLFNETIHNRSNVGFYRYKADCIEYNNTADKIMAENGIDVIDLCTFTLNIGDYIYCDHVHFIDSVRKKQAAYIANCLMEYTGCKKRVSVTDALHGLACSRLNVSIVICCYNSARRLPKMLEHLVNQDVPQNILWEVIIVDNASTDNTAQIAQSLWPDNISVPFRIVKEPVQGLIHARIRGINEAKHEIVSFLDDDNWAGSNWVKLVSEIMTTHPEVGACGGCSKAETEIDPPAWFSKYSSGYVVGSQSIKCGDITWSKGWLWGAGLTIRKKAWNELNTNGFQQILSGRSGNKILSGEDVEICYALRLAGWRLWYSDELALRHYIPVERLTVEYLSKLQWGFGAQTIGFDPYNFYVRYKSSEIKRLSGKIWLRQLVREFYISLFRDCSFWRKWVGSTKTTFNHHMLWLRHWGRISTLWKSRKKYDYIINFFKQNQWIRIARQTANYLHQNPDFGDKGNPDLSFNPQAKRIVKKMRMFNSTVVNAPEVNWPTKFGDE